MQTVKSTILNVRSGILAGKITVYGKDTCSWTVKQKQYLDGKRMPYTYVDCSSQSCPSFVSGFPTLDVDGKIIHGFTEI